MSHAGQLHCPKCKRPVRRRDLTPTAYGTRCPKCRDRLPTGARRPAVETRRISS